MNNLDINSESPFAPNKIDRIILDKMRIAVEGRIPDNWHTDMRCLDNFGRTLAVTLTATLLGENLGEVILEYPETWWDGFKEIYFPKWLKKRYPVEIKKHYFKQKVAYPGLKIPSLADEQVVYYLERKY